MAAGDHNGLGRLLAQQVAALVRHFASYAELARRVTQLEQKQHAQAERIADLEARLEQLEAPKH